MKLFLSLPILFLTCLANASGPFQIQLTANDQAKLIAGISKIDYEFQSQEVIQEKPFQIIRKRYGLSDATQAFSIECSEETSFAWNNLSRNKKCTVSFSYEASRDGYIVSRDGFVTSFATAKITDPVLVQKLTKILQFQVKTDPFYFHTLEKVPFTHPQTGQKFELARLRIDCTQQSCEVMAIK